MEAGNRGAAEAGGVSIGLNIVLPHEQAPNLYVTPELSFNFHYFAIRKMHFLMRAKAIAVFPGGFGTLDELFEMLTLIQTGRMARLPILLFGARVLAQGDRLGGAGRGRHHRARTTSISSPTSRAPPRPGSASTPGRTPDAARGATSPTPPTARPARSAGPGGRR